MLRVAFFCPASITKFLFELFFSYGNDFDAVPFVAADIAEQGTHRRVYSYMFDLGIIIIYCRPSSVTQTMLDGMTMVRTKKDKRLSICKRTLMLVNSSVTNASPSNAQTNRK